MSEPLFDEFPPISREEWLEKITLDLKGRPLESLHWTSAEGIDLSPVFSKEDLPAKEWLANNFPGGAPFLRGDHPLMQRLKGWEIRHDFRAETVEENIQLIKANSSELGGVSLVLGLPFREFLFDWEERDLPINHPRDGIHLNKVGDLTELLNGIDLQGKKLHLRAGHAVLPLYAHLISALREAEKAPSELVGTLDADPFNRMGSDPSNRKLLDLLLDDTAAIIHHQEANEITGFRSLRISLEPHHFIGANAVQQVVSALGMAAEYADVFQEKHGINPETTFRNIHFSFPIDTDFFTEIAKIRAFRWLYSRMLSAYNLGGSFADYLYIHGQGAARSMSALDPNVNLLRSTTEAMSAIMGGCHAVSMPTYNSLSDNSDGHAIRIARNIQLVLRDEALLDKVIDPGGGSYYLEYLTAQIAEKAWQQFVDMEAGGGYLATWQKGELPRQLLAQRAKLDSDVSRGKYPMLGVNRFPNAKDELPTKMTTGYARKYPLPAQDFVSVPAPQRVDAVLAAETLVELGTYLEGQFQYLGGQLGKTGELVRLSEGFEELRTNAAEYAEDGLTIPKVFLFAFGPLTMRKARAAFSKNLFESGGFVTLDNPHPNEPDKALAGLAEENPSVVVLCSADEQYLSEGGEMLKSIGNQLPNAKLYLAGKPNGWEALKDEGLHGVIHVGMDNFSFLKALQVETEMIQEVNHEA